MFFRVQGLGLSLGTATSMETVRGLGFGGGGVVRPVFVHARAFPETFWS